STGSGAYDCNWGPSVITSLAPSTSPPGGLAVDNVPQFVAFGFEDNRYTDGIEWATNVLGSKVNNAGNGNHCTFDGAPVRVSFYVTSFTMEFVEATRAGALMKAYQEGNEIANHTDTHGQDLLANGLENVWLSEMNTCNGYLMGIGVPKQNITGFRPPFLQYTQATFAAITKVGFAYDCSVEHYLGNDGMTIAEDWPYTLDNGASPRSYIKNDGTGNHPGLWELPVHEFMPATGWLGVTGIDYNVFCAK